MIESAPCHPRATPGTASAPGGPAALRDRHDRASTEARFQLHHATQRGTTSKRKGSPPPLSPASPRESRPLRRWPRSSTPCSRKHRGRRGAGRRSTATAATGCRPTSHGVTSDERRAACDQRLRVILSARAVLPDSGAARFHAPSARTAANPCAFAGRANVDIFGRGQRQFGNGLSCRGT